MNRELCRYCRKPMANAQDCDEIQPGEGEHLCWQILQGCDQDQEEAIDLRDAEIARLERELAHERQAIEILWRCGLLPSAHPTLMAAATGVHDQIQYFRAAHADPPHHIVCASMRKMGVYGFMEPGETATLRLVEYEAPGAAWKESRQ